MGCRTGDRNRPWTGCSVYLKRVDMENFKSFGGKISVPLMEGYMGITGPNGSGKSNITDAIMFVLGPRSPKVVRAGRQTDLIHNGNKASGKADHMKVTLIFDNTDRMLAWDSDEVRFTRIVKMASNGVDYNASFYINDQRSNAAEFDSLFERARISSDGYNFVRQGDVTDITKMGAVERRRVIDRISGIESYDADIASAEKERAQADQNIRDTQIVIDELNKQLKQLQKDMEAAKRHIELKEKLDLANAQLKYRLRETEQAKVTSTEEAINRAQQDIERLEKKKEDLKAKFEKCAEDIKATEDEISARVGPEYGKLKKDIDQVKIDKAVADNDISNGEETIASLDESLEAINEESQENESQLRSCSESINAVRVKIDERVAELNAAREEEARIRAEMNSIGGEHTKLDERLRTLEKEIEAKADEESKAGTALHTAEAVDEDASRQIASIESNLSTTDFEIKDAEFNLSEVKKEAGPMVDLEEFKSKIVKLKGEERELEKQESDINSAISRLNEKYNTLMIDKRASEKASRGGSEAVMAVMAMRDRGEVKGIHGTIAQLGTVDKEYETALSVAAGGKMQAIVVDTDEVASQIISLLKKEGHGRATFLPLNKMIEGKPRAKAIMTRQQSLGYATDLIEYKPEYAAAFWYVFQDTLVMENLNDARRVMGGIRIVTKAGDLIDPSGAMTGGTIRQTATLKFGDSSQSELDKVGAELSNARASLSSIRERLADVRSRIRECDDAMRDAGTGDLEMGRKIAGYEAQLKALKDSRKRLQQELEEKKSSYAEAKKKQTSLKDAYVKLTAELEGMKAERTKIRERMAEIAPAEVQQRMATAMGTIVTVSNELTTLREEQSGLVSEKSRFDSEKLRLDGEVARINKEKSAISENMAKAKEESERLKIELEALKKIEREMESGIEELRNKKDQLLIDKQKADSDREKAVSDIETKVGMMDTFKAQLIIFNQTIDKLNAEISEIKIEVTMPVPSEETLRRSIRYCEDKISELGNVNMRAIDDYNERSERHARLTADVDKLNAQINELDTLMADLNSKKKGLFMDVYNGVSENFKTIFNEISGGGEAYMSLEDEEDPFNGGLLINAKPRNGKMLKLEALSGGEKSLTALAFIFAIQEHQPSPFYVLDEVDMFLDSVNAEIVADRIQKSSSRTQFIQVSLRNVALKKADHLIGVTRPPNGVSKVIIQPDLAEISKFEKEAMERLEKNEKKEGIE